MSKRMPESWLCRGQRVSLQRPQVMGILNCTPDSFSDGGLDADAEQATIRGLEMVQAGASIIDVGGESTRPGSKRVSAEEECQRILPVISALAQRSSVLISVDTMKASVAQAAMAAGAHVINDVSAGLADPELLHVVQETGAGVVLMHMKDNPETMQRNPAYQDVVGEVHAFLMERAQCCEKLGIAKESIAIDPGIGFGKTTEHNLVLLAHAERLVDTGYPVLIGASRKRFIGDLTGRAVHDRLGGSLAAAASALQAGVQLIRVHDVQESCDLVQVWDMIGRTKGYHVMDKPTPG